jgi:molybdopterin molybdotransferase
MPSKLIDDCFAHDSRRLRHDEALQILRERVTPVAAVEQVALIGALGRTLAAGVTSPRAVPGSTNSAVDGYAFAHADSEMASGRGLEVIGRAAAGHPYAGVVQPACAIRIFTGAVLPEGTDTVAMQEDAELVAGAGRVRIPAGLKRGANVRRAGEDVRPGQLLLEAGHRLRPQDLAALASVGVAEVSCYARLRVGIVSTGDEIVRPGQREPVAGEVFDANAPMLASLVALLGAAGCDLGVWPDRADVVEARLLEACRRFDVILTSGGASRGEEDHMVRALAAIGRRHLWQLAIKPGRPMSMGQIGDTIVLGLPGNPVAVLVCFLLYAAPMLQRLGGGHWREPRRFPLPAAFDELGRKTGRREFWRGILVDGDRSLAVDKFQRDGSGLITGLRQADGLIEIPEDVQQVRRGDVVAFIPFSEFGILR